jgi:hypothetical protein
LIFCIVPFGTRIAHPLKQVDGEGDDGQVISIAVDRLDGAPGQRVTGQSCFDQNSGRSWTPRKPVHATGPVLP